MRKHSTSILLLILIFIFTFSFAVSQAESYEASTMRLLRHSGAVEIFDASGAPRFLLDNVRFASGESIKTGEDGTASVSLDDSKILTMDVNSLVQFLQEAGHMQLNLLDGSLFLDVQKKLDENESFDIQTTTMTVGIRGTLVYASSVTPETATDAAAPATVIGVLEGTGRISYTDSSGAKRVFDLPAGQKVTLPEQPSGARPDQQPAAPEVSSITSQDLPAYVAQTVLADDTLTNRVSEGSPDGAALLLGTLTDAGDVSVEPFPASGDWTWIDKVTLVAQSASKLYDGVPLTRNSDALVYGLPGNFHVSVSCTGSITNAGRTDNTVSSFSIFNGSGENVTGHFTNIETVRGSLVVDPAPLVVWTGSAEKIYDGTPLVCPDAGIRTVPGRTAEDPAWKNSSLVTQTAGGGSEKMVALSGRTYVQGTNPLTGDTQKIELRAGQSLSVNLFDDNGKQGIKFEITDLTVDKIPDDVLRLYADNPDLLEQACLDTNWDRDAVNARIADLKSSRGDAVTGTGLTVPADARDNVMTDSTNVRIHIDSGITNYSTRPLTDQEASFTPITLDPSIIITAIGSQTEVGESENTYTIDWGNAKSSNYILKEDLGTLTVTEAMNAVTIHAGSASKEYDGTPLRANRYEAEGLPEGCTVTASVSGSVTDVGSARNNITSYKITDAVGTDITDRCIVSTVPGRLTVRPAALTVTTGSAQKVYDGEPLTCDDVSVSGLASGESVTVTASGSITDPGSAENTYSISWDNASESNYTVSVSQGTLTVDPLAVEINCGGSSQEYTGELAFPEPSLTYKNGTHAGETVYGTRASMMSGALHGAPHRAAGDDIKYTFSLFTGDVVSLTVSGLSADVGTHHLSCTVSSTLPGLSWSVSGDTVTIQPISIEIDCGGGTFTFADSVDLTLSCNGVPYEFGPLGEDTCETEFELDNGDVLYLTVSGYPVDTMSTGTWMLTKSVSFETGKASDYNITYTNDKITIGPRTVYISKPDETRVYNGYPGPETTDIIVSNDPLNLVDASVGGDTYYAVDVGTYPMEAYTWVEYEYSPCIEFDTSGMGTLTILPAEVTLTSASDSKTYDTEPLTAEEVTVSGDGFAYGEGAEFSFTGSQTDAGSSSNTFTYTLNEDTKASNYKISTEFGTLTVDKAPVTVSTPVKSKTYDGEPLVIQEPDITINGLQGSESIDVSLSDNTVTKGGASITPKLTVTWSNANPDNYEQEVTAGTLTVNKAPLTVTTGSAQKRYDGTPLKTAANDYEIDGIIYDGDVVNIILTGSQTEEGSSNNTFVVDEATSVNADCYEITPVLGTLTVAPRIQITVSLGGRTIQANPGGQPVDFDRTAVIATDSHGEAVPLTLYSAVVGRATYTGTLPTGGAFELTVTGSGIEPGTYDINCSVSSSSEDFSDYEFVPTNNVLTVIPAEPATTDGV